MLYIHSMNLRKLDLNLLLVFDAVYGERSITQAAAKLALSQPAVSNALNRLRNQLDDPLFERQGKGIRPTDKANALAPQIRQAMQVMELAMTQRPEFDPAVSKRQFTILTPDAVEMRLVLPLLAMIERETPNVTYLIKPLIGSKPVEQLAGGEIDLAILPSPPDDPSIRAGFLFHDEVVLVASRNHPVYGARETFTEEDFVTARFVTMGEDLRNHVHLERESKASGKRRNIVCETKSIWSLLHTAAGGNLVAATPKSVADVLAGPLNLRTFKVPLRVPAQAWHMVWHAENDDDPAHRWLRGQIKGFAQAAPQTPDA